LQQPFFFLVGPAAPLLLDGAKFTDLSMDADQLVAEFAETVEFGYLLLCFAQCDWIGKGLSYGPTGYSSSQSELGIMTKIVGFGAMAGRLTAAPNNSCNRTGPKITQAEELLQELGTIGL
jgi:hypothetical protein